MAFPKRTYLRYLTHSMRPLHCWPGQKPQRSGQRKSPEWSHPLSQMSRCRNGRPVQTSNHPAIYRLRLIGKEKSNQNSLGRTYVDDTSSDSYRFLSTVSTEVFAFRANLLDLSKWPAVLTDPMIGISSDYIHPSSCHIEDLWKLYIYIYNIII